MFDGGASTSMNNTSGANSGGHGLQAMSSQQHQQRDGNQTMYNVNNFVSNAATNPNNDAQPNSNGSATNKNG
jgi:hypothetical protein